MSCNRCYLLLKDLDLKCFTQNKLCSESELRTDLKKANLLFHPDKNSDPDSHEKFIKYSKCIKFLLENYSCYNDKFSHCNSVTHSFTKGFSTKPKCIKFSKRTSKSTGDCPSGGFCFPLGCNLYLYPCFFIKFSKFFSCNRVLKLFLL